MKRTIEKTFHQLVILMEQESKGWKNCDPSPFGKPSSIETHVSTPPPLGLAWLDPIQEVIFLWLLLYFIISSYFPLNLVFLWFYFNLFFVSFGYVFSVGTNVPRFFNIIISTRIIKTTSHLTCQCFFALHTFSKKNFI